MTTLMEKMQLMRQKKKQQEELQLQKRRAVVEQQREAQIQKRLQVQTLAQQQRQAVADREATKKRKMDDERQAAADREATKKRKMDDERREAADREATKKRKMDDERREAAAAAANKVAEAKKRQEKEVADRVAKKRKADEMRTAASSSSASSRAPPPPPPGYEWSEEQLARIRKRSYLGPRGYTVWTDAFQTKEEREAAAALMKFQLLVAPDASSRRCRTGPPKSITLGTFGAQKCFFPKAQALEVFGLPEKDHLPYHRFLAAASPATTTPTTTMRRPSDLFAMTMFEDQKPIIAQCLRELRAQFTRNRGVAGIILQAGCGVGKTLMSIAMATVAIPRIAAGLLTDAEIDDLNLVLRPPPPPQKEEENEEAPSITATATATATTPAPGAILVIVNKNFLLNQWVKNLNDACPGARIGTIVGAKHQVQGCNFVIGMVQTMFSKSYGPETFAPFQTVIIDEAHCVCSDQFRLALVPLVAPFTIALSATVDKKTNGMIEVLLRYVGPVAYRSPVAPTAFLVTVRLVHFTLFADSDYSRVDMTVNGELDYSSTIRRVSMHPARLDAGADTLVRYATEDPERQVLVLCTLRAPLNELKARVDAWNADPATPADQKLTYGFYLGGMKQEALEASSTCHIIFATYAMAAEALDIPTLDAVFMYNSKADITQSIGRAMRLMNNHKCIIEMLDGHQVFQSQLYRKRMPEYRSRGFHVYKASYQALAAAPKCVFAGAASSSMDYCWKPVFLPRGFVVRREGGGAIADDDSDDDGVGGNVFGNDDDDDDA